MKIKKAPLIITLFIIGFITFGGVKALAEDFWAGQVHVQTIHSNIDILTNRIFEKEQTIKQIQNGLNQSTQENNNLSFQIEELKKRLTQVENDKQVAINQKIEEINQKIEEGNQKIAVKQKELDLANSSIHNLQQELNDLKNQSTTSNNQALFEIEQIRNKTDQAVNQTSN